MPATRLSDIIVPEVFFGYMDTYTKERTEIFRSGGFMRMDADLASKLAGGGRTFNVPFWKDLADDESQTANDDPNDLSTPANIGTGRDICRRQFRTKSWSTMNLTSDLAGDDPMQAILRRVNMYWERQFQSVLVNTLRGVFEDNIANYSGDMVYDIATDSASAITAAEKVSAEAILEAKQTMGDAANDLVTLVMHSVVFTELQKQNLIDYLPDSQGVVNFPTYLGYRVVIDDGCPAVAGTNRTTYWTFLMGRDAIGWAEVPPANMPVETDTVPAAGAGSGAEILYTRRQYALHPYGIKWTDSSVAGEFPTFAELRTASNWDRVYEERKQIPMALLQTNG